MLPDDVRPEFEETEQSAVRGQAAEKARRRRRREPEERPARHHHQEAEEASRTRPSRRRVEGRVRRLRHRDDGVLPGDVDRRAEPQRARRRSPATSATRACSISRSRTARCRAARCGSARIRRREDPSSKEVLKEAQQALEKAASRIKSLLAEIARVEAAGEADRDHGDARRPAHRAAGGREPTFFASGSAALAPSTESVLALISQRAGQVEERHRARRAHRQPARTSHRRAIELGAVGGSRQRGAAHDGAAGLRDGQIHEIRGYADTSLRVKSKPLDPRNRQPLSRSSSRPARNLRAALTWGPPTGGPPSSWGTPCRF